MSYTLTYSHFCNVIPYNIKDKSFPGIVEIASPRPVTAENRKLKAYFNIQHDYGA